MKTTKRQLTENARRHIGETLTIRWPYLLLMSWIDKLKSQFRDWCFADYKWITRAQVQGTLCCKMWEYRDDSIVSQHVRKALREVGEDIG